MVNSSGYNPDTGEWNDSLTGDFLWSSVNTREASPDVMTPYTWSAMRHGFAQMIMLPGYLPVGNICGRAYNNASVTLTAVRAMGMNPFSASGKELYGIDTNAAGDWNVPVLPVSLRDRFLVFRNALRIMGSVRNSLRHIHSDLRDNPAWCEAQLRTLASLEKKELAVYSDQVLLPRLIKCFWWMVSSAVTQSNLISKLRGDLLKRASPDDTIALLSNVSTEDEFLASLGIVAGLDRLRRGTITREEYVRKYGHRGPHEVELSMPRPAENPNWIDEQLQDLDRSPVDVDTLLDDQRRRYEAALENLRKNSSRGFSSLMKRLDEAARLTRLRELGRSESIRTMWTSRAFAQRAGALCGLGEDVFYLEFEEILRLLAGQDDSTDSIPIRKKAYQKFTALPQYPTIIMGQFSPDEWAADPNRRSDVYDAARRITKRFTDQITGLPGSAGTAQGQVRVLNSPEEGSQLQPGEILVAITTNVGWTPIFTRAAAVVTDVGAPLSHAAIVARELGIPAVVGCFNATSQLKTGDIVRVDGGAGKVEIVNRQQTTT